MIILRLETEHWMAYAMYVWPNNIYSWFSLLCQTCYNEST